MDVSTQELSRIHEAVLHGNLEVAFQICDHSHHQRKLSLMKDELHFVANQYIRILEGGIHPYMMDVFLVGRPEGYNLQQSYS